MADKTYKDRYWVTITIDRNSPNVQYFFRNEDAKKRHYAKYPKGGKLEKIVIGCANWVEGADIEANFEYHNGVYEGLVVRKSGSMSRPRIDEKKYKVTYLTRAQAEKKFPASFMRLKINW